jgi:hypothetical protein
LRASGQGPQELSARQLLPQILRCKDQFAMVTPAIFALFFATNCAEMKTTESQDNAGLSLR